MLQEHATVLRLESEVEAHYMCLELRRDSDRYTVVYPDGYFPEGVVCRYEVGKAIALRRVLTRMEQDWEDNL